MKADKIKLALEKLKEAKVKKVRWPHVSMYLWNVHLLAKVERLDIMNGGCMNMQQQQHRTRLFSLASGINQSDGWPFIQIPSCRSAASPWANNVGTLSSWKQSPQNCLQILNLKFNATWASCVAVSYNHIHCKWYTEYRARLTRLKSVTVVTSYITTLYQVSLGAAWNLREAIACVNKKKQITIYICKNVCASLSDIKEHGVSMVYEGTIKDSVP